VKKVCFLFLLIFIVFSCKGTPKNKKAADEPGLSQPELTEGKEKVEAAAAELDDESQPESDKDTLAQDDMTDSSETGENLEAETVTDDFQADEQIEEKPLIAEAIDEAKEASEGKNPSVEENKPPVPEVKPVQPPPAVAKEEPPSVSDAPVTEQSDQEKQDDAQSESAAQQQTPPPRSQPWLAPPPAVKAVKDDAPVPNRQGLILPKEEENVFSRIVRVMVGQLLEVPFRGTNWSYLEDIVSRRSIVYNSRRNDSEGMIFIFRAEEAGTFVLRFYRRDYIRDYILYDYVQVIVDEPQNKGNTGLFNPPVDRGKVTAEPRWPSALEEAALLRGGAKPASGAAVQAAPENKNESPAAPPAASADRNSTPVQAQGTPPQVMSANRDSVPAQTQGTAALSSTALSNRESALALTQGTDTAPPAVTLPAVMPPAAAPEKQNAAGTPAAEKQEKLPPEEILKKAQESFKDGNTAAAIALLDQYTEYYPNGGDELYWLYGQFYEANTTSRNILLSLDYYRRLVNEYPQSRRYNDARRRIAYLERFYVNIQ